MSFSSMQQVAHARSLDWQQGHLVTSATLTPLFDHPVAPSLQADWALDRREREQQRAKQAHFRAMLDEQVRCQASASLSLMENATRSAIMT